MQMNEMPSIGTVLTYGEAIKAYDRFERTMLEKAYGAELLPAVGLYDLLWQLESLAQTLGIEGRGLLEAQEGDPVVLEREDRPYEWVNGERFYLLQDKSALRKHDETHLFRVGIDGDKLAAGLDEALELLSKESTKVDVYADTYSPNRSERDFDRLGEDPFMKWVGIGFCVMMICLGISMLVHLAFQIGFCSKWFI